MPIEPLADKFKSFGWDVREINGHSMKELVDTLELVNNLYGDGKPKCIIAHTVKGHGIPVWKASTCIIPDWKARPSQSRKGEKYMAKFNKYVQIGPATATAGAAETAMVKVSQKYPNIVIVLEDMGMPGIEWFKKNARSGLSSAVLPKLMARSLPARWPPKGLSLLSIVFLAVIERAYNQIRQSILVDRFNVKITARDAPGATSAFPTISSKVLLHPLPAEPGHLNPADAVEAEKPTSLWLITSARCIQNGIFRACAV